MTENSQVLEASTAEQYPENDRNGSAREEALDYAAFDQVGRAPFGTRMRVTILLAAASWALVLAGIAFFLY